MARLSILKSITSNRIHNLKCRELESGLGKKGGQTGILIKEKSIIELNSRTLLTSFFHMLIQKTYYPQL